jgi:hypothetical protein
VVKKHIHNHTCIFSVALTKKLPNLEGCGVGIGVKIYCSVEVNTFLNAIGVTV